MASLHLALAYRGKHRDDRPHVAYCGPDADACQRAIDGALAGGVFARVERYRPNAPVVKYADGSPAPEAVVETTAPASEPAPKKAKKKKKDAPAETAGGDADA